MAESYAIILAQEIERIVSSPYPTQLKNLRDLLCARKCSQVDIHRCIAIKSCKVHRLATCLLEGLPQWPYVLDIITHLACDISVREALILQQPNLIHDIVSQAVKSETALRTRYADAAVALLAHPLGSSTSLPSNVQDLFVRLVSRTVKQPSRYTIRAVYLLLKGTSTLLLGLLDSSLLCDFEQQLLNVLRATAKKWQDSAEVPDPKITTYCLAIMAIVINTSNDQQLRLVSNSSWDSQELLVSTQGFTSSWDASAMREYFAESKKGSRTMQLLILQANNSLNLPDDTANLDSVLETLQLANEVVPAFSTSLRRSICATSGELLSKFQKKALAPNVDFRLRLLAFCFAVQLSGADGLLSMTADSIRECICHSKSLIRASHFGDVALIDHLFETTHTNNTIMMLIQSLLDHLVDSDPDLMLESQGMVAYVISKLQSMAKGDGRVAQAVADAVGTASTFLKLQDIHDRLSGLNSRTDSAGGACTVAACKAHSENCHALCATLLTNALQPKYRSHWDAVPIQTMEKILAVLDLASRGKYEQVCAHSQSVKSLAAIVFPEETSTPVHGDINWRQAMERRLNGKAQNEQQALITIFAHACADLESRCATVEEPLRNETERRRTLEKNLDDLSVSYKQLEERNMETLLRVDGLGSELEEKDEALQLVDKQIDELKGVIAQLTNTVQESRQAADQQSAELQQALDSAVLEHAATLANKQHLLEDALLAIEEANASRVSRNADVDRLEQELQRGRADLEASRTHAQQLQSLLSESETRMSEASDQTSKEQAAARQEFEIQLSNMEHQAERERSIQEQQVREIKEQAKQSVDANNASHNEVLERLSAQHGEQIAKLEARLSESEDKTREARQQIEDLSSEITEYQQTAQEQHRKIERLEKKYKAKDDEVKAQIKANDEWRSHILMGLSKPPQAQASQRRQGNDPETQAGEDPSPPTPASEIDRPRDQAGQVRVPMTDEIRSPASKRSRKTSKIAATTPSKAQARFSLESMPQSSRPTTTHTQRRRPLHSLSANQQRRLSVPVKVAKTHGHSDDAETVVDDETQYEGSEIFTGTQQNEVTMDFDGL